MIHWHPKPLVSREFFRKPFVAFAERSSASSRSVFADKVSGTCDWILSPFKRIRLRVRASLPEIVSDAFVAAREVATLLVNLINRSPSSNCKVFAGVWKTVATVVAELAKERKCLQIHDHELQRFEFSILESLLQRHAITHQRWSTEKFLCHVVSGDVLCPVEILEPTVPAVNRGRVITLFVEVIWETELSTIVLEFKVFSIKRESISSKFFLPVLLSC